MTFKAWHWKDLDGGGRRKIGREDGRGGFEEVFLHLCIKGTFSIKAKVNWTFHLLSLAFLPPPRTRRASQKRRRGFCLKRFWYPQLRSDVSVDMVWISSTPVESMEILSRVIRLLSLSTFLKTDDDLVLKGVWRLLRGPCSQVSWTRCLSFKGSFPTFNRYFIYLFILFYNLTIQPILAEHSFNRYLQSIDSSTDTCRALTIQLIFPEH